MKRSEFLKYDQKHGVKKSAIIDYYPEGSGVCYWVVDRGEFKYDGTIEQFEALLFDDDDSVAPEQTKTAMTNSEKQVVLTVLQWTLKNFSMTNIESAIARLEEAREYYGTMEQFEAEFFEQGR